MARPATRSAGGANLMWRSLHIHGISIIARLRSSRLFSRYLKLHACNTDNKNTLLYPNNNNDTFQEASTTPESAIIMVLLTLPESDPRLSIFLTTSMPWTTSPKLKMCQQWKGQAIWWVSTKDNMFSIKPRGFNDCDKELGSIGILSCISHGKEPRLFVFDIKILICSLFQHENPKWISWRRTFKTLVVNWLATSAIAPGEITTLNHKFRDRTMERGSLVAEAMFSSRELAKILCGLGDNVIIEFENDASDRFFIRCHIELSLTLTEWRDNI